MTDVDNLFIQYESTMLAPVLYTQIMSLLFVVYINTCLALQK